MNERFLTQLSSGKFIITQNTGEIPINAETIIELLKTGKRSTSNLSTEMEALKKEHKREVEELEKEHRQREDEQKQEHDRIIKSLEDQIKTLFGDKKKTVRFDDKATKNFYYNKDDEPDKVKEEDQYDIEALNSKIKNLEKELKEQKKKCDKEKDNLQKNHSKQIKDLNEKHRIEMQELQQKHQLEIKQLNSKHAIDLKEDSQEQQQEILNLQKELKKQKNDLDEAKKQLKKQKNDLDEAKKQLQEEQKKSFKTKNDTERAARATKRNQEKEDTEIQNLRKQIKELEEQLNTTTAQELAGTKKDDTNNIEELQNELETKNAKIEMLEKSSVPTIEKELYEQGDFVVFRKRIGVVENKEDPDKDGNVLSYTLYMLDNGSNPNVQRESIKKIQSLTEYVKKQSKDLNSRLEKSNTQNANLNSKVKDLNSRLTVSYNDNVKLKEEMAELNNQITQLKDAAARDDNFNKEYLETVKNQKKELLMQKNKLEAELDDKSSEVARLRGLLQELNAQFVKESIPSNPIQQKMNLLLKDLSPEEKKLLADILFTVEKQLNNMDMKKDMLAKGWVTRNSLNDTSKKVPIGFYQNYKGSEPLKWFRSLAKLVVNDEEISRIEKLPGYKNTKYAKAIQRAVIYFLKPENNVQSLDTLKTIKNLKEHDLKGFDDQFEEGLAA